MKRFRRFSFNENELLRYLFILIPFLFALQLVISVLTCQRQTMKPIALNIFPAGHLQRKKKSLTAAFQTHLQDYLPRITGRAQLNP